MERWTDSHCCKGKDLEGDSGKCTIGLGSTIGVFLAESHALRGAQGYYPENLCFSFIQCMPEWLQYKTAAIRRAAAGLQLTSSARGFFNMEHFLEDSCSHSPA